MAKELIVSGNKFTIDNYYAFDDTTPTTFSSQQGLGPSLPITIEFNTPVNSFTIKANELDQREATEVAVKYDNKDFYTVKGVFYPNTTSPAPKQWSLGLYTRLDEGNREVIFSKKQLLEKQRKLQLIIEAFSQQPDDAYARKRKKTIFSGRSAEDMKSAKWPFTYVDFPTLDTEILADNDIVPREAYPYDSYRGAFAQLGRDALAGAIFTEYTGPVTPRASFRSFLAFAQEVDKVRIEVEKTLPSQIKNIVFNNNNKTDPRQTLINGANSQIYFGPTFNDKDDTLKKYNGNYRQYAVEFIQKYIDLINDILRADNPELSKNISGNSEETKIEAFDISGSLLRSLPFTTSEPQVTINKEGIKTVKLTPIPGDYIFFSNVSLPQYVAPPAPVEQQVEPQTFSVQTSVIFNILPPPQTATFNRQIAFSILPEATTVQTIKLRYPFELTTQTIRVNLSQPIQITAKQFIDEILRTYIDEDRKLKTLVNYGQDKQSVILAKRGGNLAQSIQFKLLQPVPADVRVGDSIFVSREVAKTVVDNIRIRYAPPIDKSPYLRPLNPKVKVSDQLGKKLRNLTLSRMDLSSGSVGTQDAAGNVTFEDEIFRKWYSYDFNSSELNIDFSDYNNFVFYSSAAMRLEAFKQKLIKIENIDRWQQQFSGSIFTGNLAYAGSTFVQNESAKYASQKENIIRNFDRYEQYLYFTTGSDSPYSASVDYQNDDAETEYNASGYWPKISEGVLYPVTSSQAIGWFTSQSLIAQRFDEFNDNNLTNIIPQHIRYDNDSQEYVSFVLMTGHMFDNLKLYIDQFPHIYNRQINPNQGLSKDLINDVAESLGFKLPALNTVYNLSDNILGTVDESPRRDYTAEAYKRLLHHLPLFAKAKGTRHALDTLFRVLGISPEFLSIKEAGTPTSSSFKTFEEYSTGLDFDLVSSSMYVQVPVSASISSASLRTPKAIQFNAAFNPLGFTSSVLTGDSWWGLHAVPHPELDLKEYGKIILRSGSVDIISSAYLPIFTNELINITLQYTNDSASLQLIAADGEYSIFNETYTEAMVHGWNDAHYVYVGGSGSMVLGRFDGLIDEFRLWGDTLTPSMVETNAFDPGSNAGDLYDDATNYLYVQLSFNKVDKNILTGSLLLNESPYINKAELPSLTYISASGIYDSSFIRYSRIIRQVVPEIGGLAYVTNKVKVLTPPSFNPESLDKNGVKTLNLRKSIVAPQTKGAAAGKNQILISVSPTEFINQNIVRNLGLENINSVLGLPSGFYKAFPTTLEDIKSHYEQYYYSPVNINQFIRVLSATTSTLNQVLNYFIPTRATVLQGIVIEPNILEKPRISPTGGVRFYGAAAKRTTNAASSLTGSRSDYHATFNLQQTIKLQENYIVTGSSKSSLKGVIDLQETNIPSAYYNKYEAELTSSFVSDVNGKVNLYKTQIEGSQTTVTGSELFYDYKAIVPIEPQFPSKYATKTVTIDSDLMNPNKVPYNSTNRGSPGAEPYNRIYPRKLYLEEIQSTRIGGTASMYLPALKEIPPSADLRDYGVRTFFNDPDGVYLFPTTRKLPVFPKPIRYQSATTWSYSDRYNLYDVVYQNVTKDDTQLGELTGSAFGGNKKYYVFTTRPLYTAPSDGTSFYSGSVPSYIPPSLDRTNWQLLKFKPIQVRIPKRIVFDLFTIRFSTENNYKTTILPITTVIDVPTRAVETFEVGSLIPNEVAAGQIKVQNIALLFALQVNRPGMRIRLYSSLDARDGDITRPYNQVPDAGEGILLDTVILNQNIPMRTIPFPVLSAAKQDATLYYTINNLGTSTAASIELSLYYFTLELQPRIPFGYLRKHYRYFRDNSTATKRRNYEGCKFSIIRYSPSGEPIYDTIDGLPPVQVSVSEGTSITVASTNTNEIITGGGGQLNVT